eukprot:TRINITY_DN68500_c0_g1_i1.p1 TRINITY_DN68500_c0_g1~~TRINITY_DN68500_c0_g1_i1.p1  ORF type:complete len:610 (+),score=10.14 TRINITY_DN68500_c0_g1_i1:54-1883(+)
MSIPIKVGCELLAQEIHTNVEESLQCRICSDIPCAAARETTCCRHLFCADCFQECLRTRPRCPLCQAPATMDNLQSINPNLGSIRDALLIKCVNCVHGCTNIMEIGKLCSHLTVCSKRLVSCPHAHCRAEVIADEINTHTTNCEWRLVECTCCKAEVAACQMAEHLQQCPNVVVQCHQCGANITRAQLDDHLAVACPDQDIHCGMPGCKLQMKRKGLSHHLQHDVERHMVGLLEAVQKLWEENDEMQKQVMSLQQSVDTLTHQNSQLRNESSSLRETLKQVQTTTMETQQAQQKHYSHLKKVHACSNRSSQLADALVDRLFSLESEVSILTQRATRNPPTKGQTTNDAPLNNVLHRSSPQPQLPQLAMCQQQPGVVGGQGGVVTSQDVFQSARELSNHNQQHPPQSANQSASTPSTPHHGNQTSATYISNSPAPVMPVIYGTDPVRCLVPAWATSSTTTYVYDACIEVHINHGGVPYLQRSVMVTASRITTALPQTTCPLGLIVIGGTQLGLSAVGQGRWSSTPLSIPTGVRVIEVELYFKPEAQHSFNGMSPGPTPPLPVPSANPPTVPELQDLFAGSGSNFPSVAMIGPPSCPGTPLSTQVLSSLLE